MADLTLQSVKILRDGRSMPLLGLGTYLGEADAVKTALELGYRLIDTASSYESGNYIRTCSYVAFCIAIVYLFNFFELYF